MAFEPDVDLQLPKRIPEAVKSVDEIKRGTGAILRQGMSKIAVFRDDRGDLHSCSAVCTHLGCVVQWNDVEKSWTDEIKDATGKPVFAMTN